MKELEEIFKRAGYPDDPNEIFISLKKSQCSLNGWLSAFMSEKTMSLEGKDLQMRFIHFSCLAIAMMGADDPNDEDYIKASKESIAKAKKEFSPDKLWGADDRLDVIMGMIKSQLVPVNNLYDNSGGEKIAFESIWREMEILFFAYLLEKQKST